MTIITPVVVLGLIVIFQSLLIVVVINRLDELEDAVEQLASKVEGDVYSAPKG